MKKLRNKKATAKKATASQKTVTKKPVESIVQGKSVADTNKNTAKSEKLLLHTCCADCAIKAIKNFESNNPTLQPILYFSNSNIHPRTEYLARQKALQKTAEELNIEIIGANWSPRNWFKVINYKEDNENLRRCRKCWQLRLENTAKEAIRRDITRFSTTLMTSHYQNARIIKEIGANMAHKYQLEFLNITKKSHNIKTKGFYKQNYCGCVFSLRERYISKFPK